MPSHPQIEELLKRLNLTPAELAKEHDDEVRAVTQKLLEGAKKAAGGEPTTDQHLAFLYGALAEIIVRIKYR